MKITKTQLKRIIKEELSRVLEAYELAGTSPHDAPDPPGPGDGGWEEAETEAGHAILRGLKALYDIDEDIVYLAAANAYGMETHEGTPWTVEQMKSKATRDYIAANTAPIWNVDDYVDDAGKLEDPTGTEIINAMISQEGYHDDIFAELGIDPKPSPTAPLRSQASTSNEDEPWMEQLKRRMS